MPRTFARIRPNHDTIASHYQLQLKLMRVAKRIEDAGIPFDIVKAESMLADGIQRAGERSQELQAILKMTDRQFYGRRNAKGELVDGIMGKAGEGKTKAMGEWFWETQKAPLLVFEKGTSRPQFNLALMTKYLFHAQTKGLPAGDAAACLLEIRAAKKQTSFLQAYLAFAFHGMGKIHGGFRPFGTVGERWSASGSFKTPYNDEYSINLQNVPGKSITLKYNGRDIPLVQPLRKLFLAPKGCSYLGFDYDSQEAWLLAIFSEDEYFLHMIQTGVKLHAQNAIDWFPSAWFGENDIPRDWREFMRVKDEPKPEEKALQKIVKAAYNAAKTFMYAVAYQHVRGEVGDDQYPAIIATLNNIFPSWTEEHVSHVVRRYFELHPAIRNNYQLAIRKEVLENSYGTHPLFGGRMYVERPKVDENTGFLKNSARPINMIQNYYQQSGGFNIFGRAMANIEVALDWKEAGLMLQVHDEIGAWCPLGMEKHYGELISGHMGLPWEFRGRIWRLRADWHAGPSWGDAKS